MTKFWESWPSGLRRGIANGIKIIFTIGAFYLLLNHKIDDGQGGTVTIAAAIREHLTHIELRTFVPFVLAATGVKMVGILCSMVRWHLLLIGQGIRFNFWHVVGSFLIGRFLGTFLPSTVGLDSYKLYDAARFSDRVIQPAAATAVEKVMGLSGIFLTFLVTLPFGYPVLVQTLGAMASPILWLTVGVSMSVVGGLFGLLFRPGWVETVLRALPGSENHRLKGFVSKVTEAATSYRGKAKLLGTVIFLSFMVHFTTAAMYYFTALAVGAEGARFWHVAFASSIQIFATVLSPFTIAGEGVREIVQALLLKHHLGASQAVLSAALGFWAAEAMTLLGALFWWSRRQDYRPAKVELDESFGPDGSSSVSPVPSS